MSADNQIIVLAYRNTPPSTAWRYAAMKIWRPDELLTQDCASDYAKELASRRDVLWFEGPGASGRARTVARLLTEEHLTNGWILEYEDVLFVECFEADGVVWHLTLPQKRV